MAECEELSAEGSTISEQLTALVGQRVQLSTSALLGITIRGELKHDIILGYSVHVVDVDTMDTAHAHFQTEQVAEIKVNRDGPHIRLVWR